MKQFTIHKLADIFPAMTGEEYQELKTDIEKNGLQQPITLCEEQILDGRNRYKVCQELNIVPTFQYYNGNNPLSYVISLNLKRRHLTASQKAALAVELLPHFEEEARKRQGELNRPELSQKIDEAEKGRADEQVAELFNTNRQYVSDAKRLKEESPELFEKVKAGELSLQEIKHPHVSNNSGENEWYTPSEYVEAARKTMGSIDVDPASSDKANETIKAITYYTKETNGLTQSWFGNVWMNPPYAQPLVDEFSQAITHKFLQGEVTQACILVNNATETGWFQRMLAAASAVCFIKGRIKFIDIDGNATGAPLQGQVILYFGENGKSFFEQFKRFGIVVWTRKEEKL